MEKRTRRRVKLKDIAEKTGFTINTVSKALRGKSDLSAATRELIRSTAEEMGYIANDMAGGLRSGITRTIALIVPDISNPFFAIVAKEVDATARQHGYTIIILNTEEDPGRESEAVRLTLAKNVDGVLLFPAQQDTEGIRTLKKAGVPCVLIGRDFGGMETDSVVFDDRRGGFLATECLLRNGRRRVLMLNGPAHISSSRHRLAGYCDALRAHGLAPEGQPAPAAVSALGGAKAALREALAKERRVDAVFAFSDMIAFECVAELKALGYRVPEDVCVVGFDDIQSKLTLPFQLTTVSSDKGELAKAAFGLLLRRIHGDESDYPARRMLGVRLVERESVRGPEEGPPA